MSRLVVVFFRNIFGSSVDIVSAFKCLILLNKHCAEIISNCKLHKENRYDVTMTYD